MNIETPFVFDNTNKVCNLQCESTYWSNVDTESNLLKHKCTSKNCKSYDHVSVLENGIVSFYNEIKDLIAETDLRVHESITDEWQMRDTNGSNWYYLVNEFEVYPSLSEVHLIATWKKDGSETEENWKFIVSKNGYMYENLNETKLNKGYVQRDGSFGIQFYEFAHDCNPPNYDVSTHTSNSGCTQTDIYKDWTTTRINGITYYGLSRVSHLNIVKHSKSLMGMIENQSDWDNLKNAHFIFGRQSENNDFYYGIFLGQNANNNGVFYAKKLSDRQSYPILDHIDYASISYPYDTMTTQAKNFDLKRKGVIGFLCGFVISFFDLFC